MKTHRNQKLLKTLQLWDQQDLTYIFGPSSWMALQEEMQVPDTKSVPYHLIPSVTAQG